MALDLTALGGYLRVTGKVIGRSVQSTQDRTQVEVLTSRAEPGPFLTETKSIENIQKHVRCTFRSAFSEVENATK